MIERKKARYLCICEWDMRILLRVRVKEVEREGRWSKKGRIKSKNKTGRKSTSKVLPMFDEICYEFYQSVKILFRKEMSNRKMKKICKKILSRLKEEEKDTYTFVSEIWECC